MRGFLVAAMCFGLGGCVSAVDSSDDYFDSINGRPSSQLPSGVEPANPGRISTTPLGADPQTVEGDSAVAADPSDGQTAQDRRVVNTGDNPPPEYVDNPVAAPTTEERRPVATTEPARPVELGRPTQNIDLREYARSQRHLVGEAKYLRNPTRYSDGGNCKNYSVPEVAQIAFLSEGGPQRDRLLLDRDGDGFACGWTPDMAR
ncbi:MAG: hypothetical protein AAF429_13145 [Pseudomonadota bacterium]